MHQVIDNALDDAALAELQAVMLGKYFPWYFTDEVAHDGESRGQFCFMHTFFFENRVTSDFFPVIAPVLALLDIKALIRIKANLYTKTTGVELHGVHTDYDFPHKGALFYLNSNNGYTTLQDGTKVASVENRMLTFDSSNPHSSSTCSDVSRRVNIVVNYF